ncbi:MAG: hypothetical protein ACI8UX_000578 [Psychromonas sp.]|jgi:uncharacterized protein (DUF2141 family)
MKNVILVLCTFLIFELTPLAQDSHRVSVEVVGISEVKGKIYASISNDATSFPDVNFATSSSITDIKTDKAIFILNDIPGDADYAIVLFQDLNDNGVMDMNGNVPAEPFGFSNYVMMGPPSWEGCSFRLTEDTKLSINLYSF